MIKLLAHNRFQIQDASNHLSAALSLLTSPPMRYDTNQKKFDFKSAEEVIKVTHLVNSMVNLAF